ncbi:ABC transporter permease [Ferrovibrio sp. MS7]|uniref:ABC transporter permease n=1 Tax=Ferrovibrio plantarum TaxID=3119164 RepID=UPI0031370103
MLSLAGPFWAFLHPIIMLSIFWLIFSQVMPTRIVAENASISYGFFLATGFFVWQFCSELISTGTNVLRGNADTIKRLPVPLVFFFVEGLLLVLVGLLISFPLVLFFIVIFGIGPTATWLLAVPTLILVLSQAFSLAMICGLFNVFFRDVELMLPAALQLLLWTAPVVYPVTAIGDSFRWLLYLNPFSAPMILLREQLLYDHAGDPLQWLLAGGWAIFLACCAGLLYRGMKYEVRDNL